MDKSIKKFGWLWQKHVKVVCPKTRNTKNPARSTLAQRPPQPCTWTVCSLCVYLCLTPRPATVPLPDHLPGDSQLKTGVVLLWLLVLSCFLTLWSRVALSLSYVILPAIIKATFCLPHWMPTGFATAHRFCCNALWFLIELHLSVFFKDF